MNNIEISKKAVRYISNKLGSHWNLHRECILYLLDSSTLKITADYNPTKEHPQGTEYIIYRKGFTDYLPIFKTYNIYDLAKQCLEYAYSINY